MLLRDAHQRFQQLSEVRNVEYINARVCVSLEKVIINCG